MHVKIVTFPATRVAYITHRGSPDKEHETVRKLVAWKIKNKLLDQAQYRSYGLHYADPKTTPNFAYRVDMCVSIDPLIDIQREDGIAEKTIPEMRCALARDIGSRENNQAARYLFEQWLPNSNESIANFPLIFHYVNVRPSVQKHDAITDVFMPLIQSG